MTLKIKKQDTIFNVEGHINTTTVEQFKNHLEFLLLYTKSVTINIDKVKEIDKNGMKAFHDLYATALIYNKKFEIIGYGCKDIYEDIQHHYAA
ncbi:STAS domain-containing protein [Confluentibacter sediminis]|uniref:STAS domain-containing protein n=1 Tax=Confluentibacter sediminis TaxID=2219045 RepID=UPI000DAB65C6|nr:STAS domain-containing protein [Confluentibacter sediminis]